MPRADHELTTSLLAGGPSMTVAAVDLHVVSGPDAGLARRLHPGLVRIGTASSAELQLSDPTVSRVHCQMRVQPHGFRITDLGSTNGTFVDGVRIFDAELRGAGTIVVGSTALRLEIADEPVRVEISRADRFGDVLGASLEM